MVVHEVVELTARVLAAGVAQQQLVEVCQHVPNPLHLLRVVAAKGLLHTCELCIEHLALQPIQNGLETSSSVVGAPLVVLELTDSTTCARREVVERHLREAGVVIVGAGKLLSFGGQHLVELLPDFVEGAAEVASALETSSLAADVSTQLSDPSTVAGAAAQQVA